MPRAYRPVVNKAKPSRGSLPEKLASRIDKSAGPDGCWPQVAGALAIQINGRQVAIRRVAWFLDRGSWPDRAEAVEMTCTNEVCLNPRHMRQSTPAQRFWEQVKTGRADECWEWQGRRVRAGYGEFSDRKTRHYNWRAHRYAYAIANGIELTYDASMLVVMHDCDNPPCCNPKHLRLGTHKENTHDMLRKGRAPHQRGALVLRGAQR